MNSRRLADKPSPARRLQAQASLPLPPADDTGQSARELLLHSWPGRLFIVTTGFKLALWLIRLVADLPPFLLAINTAATIGLAFSVLFFLTRLIFLIQRRLLWRVRRKLILSYIFIGVVPSLLILGFFLLGTSFMAGTVAAYLFLDGYDDLTRQVQFLSEGVAAEIGRSPRTTEDTIDRAQRYGAGPLKYTTLSMVFVPASASGPPAVSRGLWEHMRGVAAPESLVLPWVRAKPDGFTGTTSVTH